MKKTDRTTAEAAGMQKEPLSLYDAEENSSSRETPFAESVPSLSPGSKGEPKPGDDPDTDYRQRARDLFRLACERLAEIIPQCDDPVKLLKCIEQFRLPEKKESIAAPQDIDDTPERIRRFREIHAQRYPYMYGTAGTLPSGEGNRPVEKQELENL